MIVIRDQTIPVDGRTLSQRSLRQPGNNPRFAPQMFARGLGMPARWIDDTHRIFDRNELFTGLLTINLGSAQTRKNQRYLAGD